MSETLNPQLDPVEMGWRTPVEKRLEKDDLDSIIFRNAPKRIEETDFFDVIDRRTIGHDRDLVRRLKTKFHSDLINIPDREREDLERGQHDGEKLEIICNFGITYSGWAGPDAQIIRTSEFDDIVNGVDAVIEFNIGNPPKRIALAIDASRGDKSAVGRKVKRNEQKLLGTYPHGKAEVKYFKSKSPGSPYRGTLHDVIPVVIGISGEECDKLTQMFGQILHLREFAKNGKQLSEGQKNILRERLRELEEHPAQIIFLREIESQLVYYRSLVENPPQTAKPIVSKIKIEALLKIVQDILHKKSHIKPGDLSEDRVFRAIQEATS